MGIQNTSNEVVATRSFGFEDQISNLCDKGRKRESV